MEKLYIKLSEIKPNEYNPKRIKKADLEALKESLKRFGQVTPLVLNKAKGRENILIGGHQRLKAMKELGWKEAWVVYVDIPDLEKEKELCLRLSKNQGDWDVEKLSKIDFSLLKEVGWTKRELNSLLDFTSEKPSFEKQIEIEGFGFKEKSIIEILQDFDFFLFNFSGGKDSSLAILKVLPLIKRQGKPFEAVFVDTGVELPSVKAFVFLFAKQVGIPLKVLKPKRDFFEIYGRKEEFPDSIFRDCITVLINATIDKYSFSLPGKVLNIRGGRPEQKTSRSKTDFFQKVKSEASRKKEVFLLSPLYQLSLEEYEKEKKSLPLIWEGYKKGFVRTACWTCPFVGRKQWEALKKNNPICWEYMRQFSQQWKFKKHIGDTVRLKFYEYWREQWEK